MSKSRGEGYRQLKSEINIVPLLDVLLVLLLVFMITTPLVTQSVKVDLPDAIESQALNINNDSPVIIEVFGMKQYSVIIEKNRMDHLPPEQVITKAQQRLSSHPKTIFLIGGGKELPYDEIMKALNLLHSAGVKSVGLMTHPI